MKYIFFISCILGLLYFLLKRRKFDFFTIGFFSSLMYFSPGFVGYVLQPRFFVGNYSTIPKVNIDPKVYILMSFILLSIIFSAIISDMFLTKRILHNTYFNKINFIEGKYVPFIWIILILITWGIYLVASGGLATDKSSYTKSQGIILIILSVSTSLLFVHSFQIKKYKGLIFSSISMFFLFLNGDRTYFTISILAIILIIFSKKEIIVLIKQINFKFALILAIFFILIINGKSIYSNYFISGFNGVLDSLKQTSDLFLINIMKSEPFSILMILNTVIQNRFNIGFDELSDLPLQLLIMPSYFGGNTSSFNEVFTNTFFPSVHYGLAYNIWAEAFSVAGLPFFILIVVIYNIGLMIHNFLIKINDNILKTVFILLGVQWAFYIHRNSIETILMYQKYILIIYSIALICSFFIFIVRSRKV